MKGGLDLQGRSLVGDGELRTADIRRLLHVPLVLRTLSVTRRGRQGGVDTKPRKGQCIALGRRLSHLSRREQFFWSADPDCPPGLKLAWNAVESPPPHW